MTLLSKQDEERLRYLMQHYNNPYMRSHSGIKALNKKWPEGIPFIGDHPKYERGTPCEWEGPFFCRIIKNLMECGIDDLREKNENLAKGLKAAIDRLIKKSKTSARS